MPSSHPLHTAHHLPPVRGPRRIRAGAVARAALVGAALLACQLPAQATWSVLLDIASLDNSLKVTDASGGYSLLSTQEGWGAGTATNGTIPNDFHFQSWDGSRWPQADFGGSISLPGQGGKATAGWLHNGFDLERSGAGRAVVFGSLANGQSAGAFLLHDVTLTIDANATVQLGGDVEGASLTMGHEAGDQGVAFGYLKLYDSTLDLNAPGGANQPYFAALRALDGGATGDGFSASLGGQSYLFENTTGETQTRQLRFEAAVLVFTTPPVPEPQTWALWLAGLGLLGATARRRHRQG